MSFRDFVNQELKGLTEQAISRKGDYDFGNLNYINKGKRVISASGIDIVTTIYHERTKEELYIVKLIDNKDFICLCRKIEVPEKLKSGEIFKTVSRFELILAMNAKYTNKYRGLGYGSFRIVKAVEVHKTERKNGYGIIFYKTLVDKLKWTLMGDLEQYAGARELWVSLSEHPEFYVDIVDLSNAKIIQQNVKLKDALDSRIWTDEDLFLTGTKEENKVARFNRLILTAIK